MSTIPLQYVGVTAIAKANIYFDGRVVSHSILFPDGRRKTLGVIFPGRYKFETDKAERMEITSGSCMVKKNGETQARLVESGAAFEVPAKSSFEIEVPSGICEYVCSYLE
jgi:hypothetical protein